MRYVIKLHKRHRKVNLASREVGDCVAEIFHKHDLTFGEIFNILSRLITDYSILQIKYERKKDN